MINKISATIDAKKIHSICINCCGLLGDTLIRVPFIEALAKLCTEAKITVITDKGKEILLRNHPAVTHVLTFNRQKSPRWTYIKDLIHFIFCLRRNRYDLLINLYGGGSSVGITKFSKAKYRLGFYRNTKEKKAYTHGMAWPNYIMDSLMYHWGQQFGLLLSPFALQPEDLRAGTTFIPTATAVIKAKTIIQETTQAWVLINLGAGDARKIWPIENYFTIAKWLHATYDYHIGIFINPGQEYLATNFIKRAKAENFTAVTPLKIPDLDIIGALMQQAKFVISGDTGLMHIAFGVKAPIVTIFSHTRPEHVAPEDVMFIPCFIEDRHKKNDFDIPMGKEDLSVDYVKNKIVQLQEKLNQPI